MQRKQNITPTEAELDVLKVLWTHGPSTVRFVNDELNKSRRTGYTTTLKIMQIMFDKGIVRRNEESRTHVYESQLAREDVEKRMVRKLLDSAFSGSAARMVMQALGSHRPSKMELEKIKELIRDIENDQN